MSQFIGFNENTSEKAASKFIAVSPETAIADDRFIHKIETGQNDQGQAWLQVEVVDSNGSIANKRWFEPQMGGFVDTVEKLKSESDKVNRVVANIVRRFKGEQFVITGAATWKQYFDKVVEAVTTTANWDKKQLRCIVVNGKTTDKGTFPTLPNFAPIFEDLSVPRTQTKLKITKYHDVREIAFTPSTTTAPVPDGDMPLPAGSDAEVGF
jgi:hypothetical protein